MGAVCQMTEPYLCNLIIPGAGKSGTTSLHSTLALHPEICGSEPKEPQFFSFDERWEKGSEAHNAIFPRDDRDGRKYFLESSQCYFAHPKAISRIASSLSDPKIIILLRHPVERLVSQYKWNFRRGTERSSLSTAIEERGETTDYVFDPRINCYREVGGYTAFSRYSKWVPLWQSEFGADRVLVLRHDDIKSAPEIVLKKCFQFLEISDLQISVQKKNKTSETHAVVFPDWMRKVADNVPAPFKKSYVYDRLRHKVCVALTREAKISQEELEKVNYMLEAEVAYFSLIPSLLGGHNVQTSRTNALPPNA
ncbi:MAG: hypothetical protein D6816_13980 [Bacteroidetes bacterium]|nr:MAG: hypothetical protein D6816_13980 [Bacteroidota bacterium]